VHLPIKGAHVTWVTFLTLLPWTIVAVFDAIDHTLRRRSVVALRLGVSTTCIVVAYAVGTWYVVELVALSPGDGRWDECATVLVAMFFNLYVGRRGLGVGVGIGVGGDQSRARWWGHGHRGGLVPLFLFTREWLLTQGRCRLSRFLLPTTHECDKLALCVPVVLSPSRSAQVARRTQHPRLDATRRLAAPRHPL